jgi:hypothetical protein
MDEELRIESKGRPVSYQAVVDRVKSGDIKRLCLPANNKPVASDLSSLFFYGEREKEYTLRGWTSRDRCILAYSAEVLSHKPDEIVIQVNVDAAGTFKVISTDPSVKAGLAGKLRSYQEKTVKIKRTGEMNLSCGGQRAKVCVNDNIICLVRAL